MPGNCHLCKKADAKASCGGCKSVFYCDRQCQVKHWSTHKLECKTFRSAKEDEKKEEALDMHDFTFTLPPFDETSIRIQQTNNCGYGMFANCEIKRGTTICKEKAMMVLPEYAKQKTTFYIKQQFLLLSETQKNIYKSLSRKSNQKQAYKDNDNVTLLNIFVNNQIVIKQRKSCCIFPLISRVNHSCVSNAHWIWNEKMNEERLIALNDIKSDEEIFANYCDEWPKTKGERNKELKTKWNIECKCEWCSDDSDIVINEYNKLEQSLESLISNPLNGYKSAQKLVKMVEKHFNSNANLLNKHCYSTAQFALGLQKWSEASYYLERAIKEKQIAEGLDIEIDSVFMEKVYLLPTKFRSRFRKFDPKYIKARMQKNNRNKNKANGKNDDLKQVSNNAFVSSGKKKKNGKTKNVKKSNAKSNVKGKSTRNNKSKNNKNKKKKTKK